MKTIREWFESVSDPKLKEELLYELDNSSWNKEHMKRNSLAGALRKGFRWANTEKGYDYWNNIKRKMQRHPKKFLSQYSKQKSKLNI